MDKEMVIYTSVECYSVMQRKEQTVAISLWSGLTNDGKPKIQGTEKCAQRGATYRKFKRKQYQNICSGMYIYVGKLYRKTMITRSGLFSLRQEGRN